MVRRRAGVPVSSHAGRAPLTSGAFACAGRTDPGQTTFPSSIRSGGAGGTGGTGSPREPAIRPRASAIALFRRPSRGSCTVACSFCAVFRYPCVSARAFAARPVDLVLPSGSAGGARGVWAELPFAGLVPRSGWRRRFRRFRAHVPLSLVRPPRLVFVGVIRSFARLERCGEAIPARVRRRANDRSGTFGAIDFWALFPSAIRFRRRDPLGRPAGPVCREACAIAAAGAPALGLSSLRVVGRAAARTRVGSTPRGTSVPGRGRRFAGGGPAYPLVGFGDPPRSGRAGGTSAGRFARPRPAAA